MNQVGVIYTQASDVSCEGERLAKFLSVLLVTSGSCKRVVVVSLAEGINDKTNQQSKTTNKADSWSALGTDGQRVSSSQLYKTLEHTRDCKALDEMNVWILCTDATYTQQQARFLHKRTKSLSGKRKRIVLSLQTTCRETQFLQDSFPSSIVLIGGACFPVLEDPNGVLFRGSSGCFFIERLSKDKSEALYAIDMLESTGISVLSRKNLIALKWGNSMCRLLLYLTAAKPSSSASAPLRDARIRQVFLQLVYEMVEALDKATPNRTKGWMPDTSANCWLSPYWILVILGLPNWLFNTFCLPLLDLGELIQWSSIQDDIKHHRKTEFELEYSDLLSFAKDHALAMPTFTTLESLLSSESSANKTTHHSFEFCSASRHQSQRFLWMLCIAALMLLLIIHELVL